MRAAQGGLSGTPEFLIAPPRSPDGVQRGVNRASGTTKHTSIQVKVFETKNASRSYHRHFFLGIALFRFTCDKNRRASRDPRELPEPPKDLPRTSGDPKMAVSTAKYACISDLSPFI